MSLNRLQWLCHGVWLYKAQNITLELEKHEAYKSDTPPFLSEHGQVSPCIYKSYSEQDTSCQSFSTEPSHTRNVLNCDLLDPRFGPNATYLGVMHKYASVTCTFFNKVAVMDIVQCVMQNTHLLGLNSSYCKLCCTTQSIQRHAEKWCRFTEFKVQKS